MNEYSGDVPINEVRRGDLAYHTTKDLDPREVYFVTDTQVWLLFSTFVGGPYPKENYEYTREEV